MEELPSDARKVLLESVLEVSEPAFETLLQLAPPEKIHANDLESIGWIAVKNARDT
jgi:hypothetical protein